MHLLNNLRVTKFLVEISQFKLLFMIEKNVFIYNFYLKHLTFNLLLVGFDFAVLWYVFFRVFFDISAFMKLQIASHLHICIASCLACQGIIMLNFTGCCCFLEGEVRG